MPPFADGARAGTMPTMRGMPSRRALAALAILALGAGAPAAAALRSGASTAAMPHLTAAAAAVRPGATFTLRGSGFPAAARLTLLAGPPHGRKSPIGSARTGRNGDFVATIRVRARAAAGAFVALACRDACRVRASARFRIIER